jgi:hypothetical protein
MHIHVHTQRQQYVMSALYSGMTNKATYMKEQNAPFCETTITTAIMVLIHSFPFYYTCHIIHYSSDYEGTLGHLGRGDVEHPTDEREAPGVKSQEKLKQTGAY